MNLIPAQYRLLTSIIALMAALAAAAGAGAVVNGWRLSTDHQQAIAAEKATYAVLLARYNDLALNVERQNGAADLLAYKTQAADDRRALAEKYAAGIVQASERRIAEIKASPATNCDGVLRESWGK